MKENPATYQRALTILFVDDDKSCHEIASLMLQYSTNYKMLSAYNGSEALSICRARSEEIDIILLDLTLPDISGDKIYKAIKQDGILAHIPIVFQSGLANQASTLAQSLHEEIHIIYKPYDRDTLIAAINRVTKTKRNLQPIK